MTKSELKDIIKECLYENDIINEGFLTNMLIKQCKKEITNIMNYSTDQLKLNALKELKNKYKASKECLKLIDEAIREVEKNIEERNKKYNKNTPIKNDKKRTDYTVDLTKISHEKAREILCKDIRKACKNCNNDPKIKKLLYDALKKIKPWAHDKEYKEIKHYIDNNNFFYFEDGGDYFSVCRSYQIFICECYPQEWVGDELERICSFPVDISYGDGDEGCLYINGFTD